MKLNSLVRLALFFSTLGVCLLVSRYVPDPYMDEIFHVNQTREYCAGHFWRWNSKITTPPGLYLIVTLLLKPLTLAFGWESVCQTAVFRCFNVIFLTILHWTVGQLLTQLHTDKRSTVEKSLTALNICLFPILHFFSTLYYTDVLSTLAVLQVYLATLNQRQFVVILWSILAVSVRQTNVVWVGFAAGVAVCRQIAAEMRIRQLKRPDKTDPNLVEIVNFAKQLSLNDKISCLLKLVGAVWPQILVILAFFLAALVNGGMALGDKSAHQVCLHLPQLMYFCLFTGIFGAPILAQLDIVKAVWNWMRRCNKLWLTAVVHLLAVPIFYLTYDHPYLLADNRHFSFYIWQRFFQRYAAFKFTLIPVYIITFIAVNLALRQDRFDPRRFLFWLCTAAVTVPNRLIEPRYLVIPFILWRLSLPVAPRKLLLFEMLVFLTISTVVWLLFLFKPFRWPHEPTEWQRFIW